MNLIPSKQFFIEKTKLYFRPLTTLFYFISIFNNGKLLQAIQIINSIKNVETNKDGDVYIEFKNNVILDVNGSVVVNTKHELIVSYVHGSFAPDFNVDKLINKKDINGSIISLIAKRKEVSNIKIASNYKTLEEALGDNKTDMQKDE